MTESLKLTHDRSAGVDKAHHWIPIDPNNPPARHCKWHLIVRKDGVAHHDFWEPGSRWTHYAGLPTFAPDDKTGL